MTVHHVGVVSAHQPTPSLDTQTSATPPLCDDRIPTVMHLYVCEGHPDRQGYHRHNLTAL